MEYHITELMSTGFYVKFRKDGSVDSNNDSLQFKVNVYEVEYDYSGYSAQLASDAAIGTMPTPTRDGYTFVGWSTSPTSSSVITTNQTFSKDTTLYAVWQAN